MRALILMLLVLSSTEMIHGQSTIASCCSLELSTQASPTELGVTVTNLEEAPVLVVRMSPEFDLRIEIFGENRRVPELTDYGKRRFVQPRSGSRFTTVLKQKETVTQVLELRKIYILNPGTYELTVSRDVFIGEAKVELQAKAMIKVP